MMTIFGPDRKYPADAPIADRADQAVRLINELYERGIELRIERERVRWRAPTGAMTVDLLRKVKHLERELAGSTLRRLALAQQLAQPDVNDDWSVNDAS